MEQAVAHIAGCCFVPDMPQEVVLLFDHTKT